MNHALRSRVITVGASTLCAAALAVGIAGSASAATPPPASAQSVQHSHVGAFDQLWYTFYNRTPYALTLSNTDGAFRSAPPATVAPGQGIEYSIPASFWAPTNGGTQVYYDFTSADGARHRTGLYTNGMGDYSFDVSDLTGAGPYPASTMSRVAWDPNGDNHTADLLLDQPLTVTIDASKDQKAAADAMTKWDTANGKKFDLTSSAPAFSKLPEEEATAGLFNNTDSNGSLTLAEGTDHTESTTVTGTVGWKTSLGFMGFADAEINAKIAVGHEWDTTVSTSQSVTVTAKPGEVAWIDAVVHTAAVTGNYTFTDPTSGIVYHVDNMTLTEPNQDQSGNPNLAVDYVLKCREMTPEEKAKYPSGSPVSGPVDGGATGEGSACEGK